MHFSTIFKAALAALALSGTLVNGKKRPKPNCKGSSLCKNAHNSEVIWELYDAMRINAERNPGYGSRKYRWGDQIVCRGIDMKATAICGFWQGATHSDMVEYPGTYADALFHLEELLDQGCNVCGSVPVRSFNFGEFTVNAVDNDIHDMSYYCAGPNTAAVCPYLRLE